MNHFHSNSSIQNIIRPTNGPTRPHVSLNINGNQIKGSWQAACHSYLRNHHNCQHQRVILNIEIHHTIVWSIHCRSTSHVALNTSIPTYRFHYRRSTSLPSSRTSLKIRDYEIQIHHRLATRYKEYKQWEPHRPRYTATQNISVPFLHPLFLLLALSLSDSTSFCTAIPLPTKKEHKVRNIFFRNESTVPIRMRAFWVRWTKKRSHIRVLPACEKEAQRVSWRDKRVTLIHQTCTLSTPYPPPHSSNQTPPHYHITTSQIW